MEGTAGRAPQPRQPGTAQSLSAKPRRFTSAEVCSFVRSVLLNFCSEERARVIRDTREKRALKAGKIRATMRDKCDRGI